MSRPVFLGRGGEPPRNAPRVPRGPLAAIALGLAGCMGPNDETVVDELRVIAVVAEPPEVAPGESTTLTLSVADPLDEAPEAMLWTCTSLGDGCLEAAEPGQGATVAPLTDGQLTTTRLAPFALAAAVSDGTTVLPIPTWGLACTPGTCPAIALAEAAPAVGTDDGDALAEFLGDPYAAMESLPLTGTSLALALVGVSTRAEPVRNPVVVPSFEEPVAIDAGASIDLVFQIDTDDVATAYGYASAGGFDATDYAVAEDGTVTLTWYAPEEAGEATLWVVVNGEAGGSALWRATATAR